MLFLGSPTHVMFVALPFALLALLWYKQDRSLWKLLIGFGWLAGFALSAAFWAVNTSYPLNPMNLNNSPEAFHANFVRGSLFLGLKGIPEFMIGLGFLMIVFGRARRLRGGDSQ